MERQLLIGAAAVALIVGLTGGCGILGNKGAVGTNNEPEIMLYYGKVNPEGHVLTDSARYFADRISELTDGRAMVEIYPSGQLGGGARCYQFMEAGASDLYRSDSMSLADSGNPTISVLVLPYVFRDKDHFWKVRDSGLGRGILDNIQDYTGMVGLAYLDEGAGNFFTADEPVRRLEDIKGLKIRVQVTSMIGDTVEVLGAEAVPIAYAEPYTALESGTIDGAENPPVSYYYNKFYRVVPYCVKDRHAYTPGVILVNKITWKNLKEEYQGALVQAVMGTQEYSRTAIGEADRKTYEALEKEGVTVPELEDPQVWTQAVEPVYRKYGGEYLDLTEEIRQIQQTHTL